MKNLEKAVEKFKEITSAKDLSKNKITLAEYRELAMILQSIIDCGSGTTIMKSVSEWCKRNKLSVFEESICFVITEK